MCGILAVVGFSPHAEAWQRAVAVQTPRGPDSSGEACGTVGGVPFRLAHQRLSILDLSPAGSQPMIHPSTGSTLAFNGEIYNYLELRADLIREGIEFKGTSDTEVLLHALEHWGVEGALPRLNGAWAFVWVSPRAGAVFLSRDRFGEKPLHLFSKGPTLFVASDWRALAILTERRFQLDEISVGRFLKLGVLESDERTLLSGVSQVPRSSLLKLDLANGLGTLHPPVRYWHCATALASPVDRADFEERLRSIVIDSVRIRLRSDVPVGLLLSGGLDSSIVATCARLTGHTQVHLLSMVSGSQRHTDTAHLAMMESFLGTKATRVDLQLRPESLIDETRILVSKMAVPLNSLAMLAHNMLIREATSLGIRVVLSGQGADEALCGYRKYLGLAVQDLVRHHRWLEAVSLLSRFLVNRSVLNQISLSEGARYLPGVRRGQDWLGERVRTISVENVGLLDGETLADRQLRDLNSLSVPTLNVLEDRSSMAESCEIRLPFLDHRFIELAIPALTSLKLDGGWTKVSLRRSFADQLPEGIAWRRDKQGFSNPECELLRTTIKHQFQHEFLDPECLVFRKGLFNFAETRDSFSRYCGRNPVGKPWVRRFIQLMTLEMWLRCNQSMVE